MLNYSIYKKNKESGVAWLGMIPDDWQVNRLANLCRFEKGYGLSKGDLDVNGEFPCVLYGELYTKYKNSNVIDLVSSRTQVKSGYRSVGDEILIPGSTTTTGIDLANAKYLPHKDVLLSGDIIVLKPKVEYNKKFVSYSITHVNKIDFSRLSKGVTIYHIYASNIRNMLIVTPALDEQNKIVDFLDKKIQEIDAAISKQQQLLKLLKEQKDNLIYRTVTKGINHNVTMRDSGFEWIGVIPEHWELKKIKYLFKLISEPAKKNNDYELLSVYTSIGVRPRKELEERGNKASTTDGYWMVKKGDIIVNKLLAWMGAIGLSNYDGVTSPAYDILRKTCSLDGYYYHSMFRMKSCTQELKTHSRGIMDMRLRLYFEKFGQVFVPYPPYNEQIEISENLIQIDKEFEIVEKKAKQEIQLLTEFKNVLIFNAITGKIKVA